MVEVKGKDIGARKTAVPMHDDAHSLKVAIMLESYGSSVIAYTDPVLLFDKYVD